MTGTFQYRSGGPELPYFYHKHNCGQPGSKRRTERTIEIPIAQHWLQQVEAKKDSEVAEVGAVTPYYWGSRIQTVVDPADKKGTLRKSLFDCVFKHASVLSISTLEHIGESRYGLNEDKTPLDALHKLMEETTRFLITVPYGCRGNPFFPAFQEVLLDPPDELRTFIVSRRDDETWCPSDSLRPYGSPPKPWANTLIVTEKGGLL